MFHQPFKLPETVTEERAHVMPSADLKSHSNLTKLVLAFDIGTTYSAVAYCIHKPDQDPEILWVKKQAFHFSAPIYLH